MHHSTCACAKLFAKIEVIWQKLFSWNSTSILGETENDDKTTENDSDYNVDDIYDGYHERTTETGNLCSNHLT